MSKGSSDRRINYSLRPSKSMERKMIVEVIKEVCTPSTAKDYRYIGFGSSFFADFKLFHKNLSIDDMISIEKSNEKRVKFNKPYSCIDLRVGFSKDILPQLRWDKKCVIWLDYETALKEYMLDDISTCSRNILPNSFLIVTLRREFEQESKAEFEQEFASYLPFDFKAEDREPAKSAQTIKRMFLNRISDILTEKFAAYGKSGDRIIFKNLFDFTYRDEAKMYTFGGMFILERDLEIFSKYNFNSLEYVAPRESHYDISFPIITNKEYYILNEYLPGNKESFLSQEELLFIPKEHRESYFNTYKYYPSYIEIVDM